MKEYLKATDEKRKSYNEFAEAFMGRELKGKVVCSVLNGDLTCEYEIEIPDDIMQKYVTSEG